MTVAIALSTVVPPASAAIELFEIDPTASSLTLQGATGEAAFQEQSAGSLTTTCHGWIAADFGGTTIQLIAGSEVVLDQTNSWQPGQRGSSTPAQAAFGVTATSGSGIGRFREVVALRNLAFDISSPAVTFDNGQFDSTSLGLVIPAMTEAVLDFQVEHLVAIAGSRQLDGLNGSNTAAEATVSLLAEVQTLSIPVDLSLTCQTVVTNDTRLRFTGRVVARRGVMLLRPELLWVASPTDRQELTLVWASSYRLEHATTLSPPDWTAYADAAPVTVIAQGAMGFYRVVAKP